MVAVVAGVVLAAAGTVLVSRGRRPVWTIGAGAGAVILASVVAFVVGPAVAATKSLALGSARRRRARDWRSSPSL